MRDGEEGREGRKKVVMQGIFLLLLLSGFEIRVKGRYLPLGLFFSKEKKKDYMI